MSVRHCAATTVTRSCCLNCYAEQSHKDNVRSSAVGKRLKRKKSNSQAQLHLTPLDLAWTLNQSASTFCFTSTEARWLIRDGDREGGGGRGRKSEGSTADTARIRPERPWTAARTMEVLRRCPLAIAQRLVHCATAVSTAVLGHSHKDNVRCIAVDEQLEAKEVQLSQPSSTSLLVISSGLTCGSSSTSFLLISPGL